MGYRREDIPGMIDALKAAKPELDDWTYICVAIPGECVGRDHVRSMISDALAGHYTLGEYLGLDDYDIPKSVRLRWIDKMIRDLQQYQKETAP
jgi:hypothetical protein